MASDFATTRWSVILDAANAPGKAASQALTVLCETYWYPVYLFVCRNSFERDQAMDLTQEFFCRVLERPENYRPDPSKGRFRWFLLGCVRHFLANQADQARTLKRGHGRTFLSLDPNEADRRLGIQVADHRDPERFFERAWAVVLLDRVFATLEKEYVASGKGEAFSALRGVLLPAGSNRSAAEIAQDLGVSEGAVRVMTHRLRKNFGKILRAEIGDTVSGAAEIEDEISELFRALRD